MHHVIGQYTCTTHELLKRDWFRPTNHSAVETGLIIQSKWWILSKIYAMVGSDNCYKCCLSSTIVVTKVVPKIISIRYQFISFLFTPSLPCAGVKFTNELIYEWLLTIFWFSQWVASVDLSPNEDAHANIAITKTDSWIEQNEEVHACKS